MQESERKEFAGGYTQTQRVIETGGLLVFFGVEAWLLGRLATSASPWALALALPAVVGGFVAADAMSGAVHWFCDTWGSVSWPIIGQSVLRTFREHHFDQKAITRHDFVETNGSNASFGMLPMLAMSLLPTRESVWAWAALLCGCSMSFFVLMTSQIHKWAHSDKPPTVIGWLQRHNVILSGEHHEAHHTPPFTHHYCITAGWLNPVAERFHVFPRLERLITLMTGVEPRHDPLSDQLAAEVLRRLPPKAPLDPAAADPERAIEGDAKNITPQPRIP